MAEDGVGVKTRSLMDKGKVADPNEGKDQDQGT